MKKKGILFILLLLFGEPGFAQKMQYSRHLMKFPNADGMQLVADVDGYHHIISFNRGEKPVVGIFDSNLKYISEQEINIRPNEKSRVSLLKFKDHYLLHFHVPGSPEQRFLKVHQNGMATDISIAINNSNASLLNKSSSTFQMLNQDNKLFLITNTYFDSLKIIACTIIQFDENYTATQSSSTAIPYEIEKESLLQLNLQKEELFILKKSRNVSEESILKLVKIDLHSKKITTKEFGSINSKFFNAEFRLNTGDSTILVSSILPESTAKKETRNVIFLSRLDYNLQELTPPVILRTELNNELSLNILMVNNSSCKWIPFTNRYQQRETIALTPETTHYIRDDNINLYSHLGISISPAPNYLPVTRFTSGFSAPYPPPKKVKLTLLNKQLKVVKTQQLKPYTGENAFPGKQFVSFSLHKTPFLIIAQNYLRKQNGLALVYINTKNEILLNDIRTNDGYEYYLDFLKVVDDESIILPFSNKKEMGLIKIAVKKYTHGNN